MAEQEIEQILDDHAVWTEKGSVGGHRAELMGIDLRDADLQGVDLRNADLRGADLTGANLSGSWRGKTATIFQIYDPSFPQGGTVQQNYDKTRFRFLTD